VKQVLVLPIATIIVLILIIGLASETITINTQTVLAEVGRSSINSSNSDGHPTISECKAAIGKSGISPAFISACAELSPGTFESVGGVMYHKPNEWVGAGSSGSNSGDDSRHHTQVDGNNHEGNANGSAGNSAGGGSPGGDRNQGVSPGSILPN
jgi:hypothetical protein